MHILNNISKSKGNQTMKFGQKHFFKIHTQKVLEKLFTGPFLKNQSWGYLFINSLTFYKVCFHYILS